MRDMQAVHPFHLLPQEVLDIIVIQLSIADVKKARLAYRGFGDAAKKHLFHRATIGRRETRTDRWIRIANHAELRRFVKHAYINVTDWHDILARGHSDDYKPRFRAVLSHFVESLNRLLKFPRLEQLTINFPKVPCALEFHGDTKLWLDMIIAVMDHMRIRIDSSGQSTVRDLVMLNAPTAFARFLNEEPCLSALKHLKCLHVQMVSQFGGSRGAFSLDLRNPILSRCSTSFVTGWLDVTGNNLKTLAFEWSEFWGGMQNVFDMSAVPFPNLEELSLGRYSIVYDDQMDWILALRSLRKLSLLGCVIIPLICISKELIENPQYGIRSHLWEPEREPKTLSAQRYPCYDELPLPRMPCMSFRYSTTWSHFFNRIAEDLRQLRHFAFCSYGPSAPGLPTGGGCGLQTASDLHPRRYFPFAMHNDTSTGVHGLADVKHGWMKWHGTHMNLHGDTLKEDKRAFRKLKAVVTANGRSACSPSHA